MAGDGDGVIGMINVCMIIPHIVYKLDIYAYLPKHMGGVKSLRIKYNIMKPVDEIEMITWRKMNVLRI
jgi:hypothetical protein